MHFPALPKKGEFPVGLGVFGEGHQAAGLPVDAVHDIGLLADVAGNLIHQGFALPFTPARNDQLPCGFVDDDEMRIFVDDLEFIHKVCLSWRGGYVLSRRGHLTRSKNCSFWIRMDCFVRPKIGPPRNDGLTLYFFLFLSRSLKTSFAAYMAFMAAGKPA